MKHKLSKELSELVAILEDLIKADPKFYVANRHMKPKIEQAITWFQTGNIKATQRVVMELLDNYFDAKGTAD